MTLPGPRRSVIDIDGGTVYLAGKNVGNEIRSPRIDRIVSAYASLPMVRNRLLGLQRDQGREDR